MKAIKFIHLWSLAAIMVIMTFASCNKNDAPVDYQLSTLSETVNFKTEALQQNVEIVTNYTTLTTKVEQKAQPWLTATITGTTLKVSVLKNDDAQARTGEISIIGQAPESSKTIKVKVSQLGQAPDILLSQPSHSLKHRDTTITISFQANIPVELQIDKKADWIEIISSKALETREFQVHVARNNNTTLDRSTTVIVASTDGSNIARSIEVTQVKGQAYRPGDPSKVDGMVRLTINSAKASSTQPYYPIEESYDDKLYTYYCSQWTTPGTTMPVTLEYNISGAERLDQINYTPQPNNIGSFKEFEIWVSTVDAPTNFTKIKEYNHQGSKNRAFIALDRNIEKPHTVRFVVKGGVDDLVSCSEMELLALPKLSFEPSAIFSDCSYSSLQPSVGYPQIEAIKEEFYHNLALSLYEDTYPKEYRVAKYSAYPDPEISQKELRQRFPYSILDNPTGIAVNQNQEMLIFVGPLNHSTIMLRIHDFTNENYVVYGRRIPLSEGFNKIKAPVTGLMYIEYLSSSPQAQPITVHFASGCTVSGYFDIKRNTNSDWAQLMGNAKFRFFDVLGHKSHMVYPTEDFKKYCTDGPERLIQVTDSIILLEQQTLGFQKYNRVPTNRMAFVVHYIKKLFMFAYPYRTSFIDYTMESMITPAKLRASDIWGPAHEVGHMHQVMYDLTWGGMDEVSNNLLSLTVQTAFGSKSRLAVKEDDGKAPYERAWTEFIAQGMSNMVSTNVFNRLVPWWQLTLYFKEVEGMKDFWADLYEKVRTTPALNPMNPGVIQLEFIKSACSVGKQDLTDFFEKCGMLRTADVLIGDYETTKFTITQAQIDAVKSWVAAQNFKKPTLAIEYINDDAVESYKNNASITTGRCSYFDNKVIMSGWHGVVAWEIFHGKQMTQVAMGNNFTIDSPSKEALTIYAVSASGAKNIVYQQ
ncbi:MAG: M60 family metallopeptidase [Mucinivorans sp.]